MKKLIATVGAVVVLAGGAVNASASSTTRIDAVSQATAQYGWPHNRTLAETVAIPQILRFDMQNAVRVGFSKTKVKPVTCKWYRLRVSPYSCTFVITNRFGKVLSTLKYGARIFEDGSYRLTLPPA